MTDERTRGTPQGGIHSAGENGCTAARINSARIDAHVAGAEGITHAMVQQQMDQFKEEVHDLKKQNREEHEEIMAALSSLQKEVRLELRNLQLWQKGVMAILSLVIFIIMFLGPERLLGHFFGAGG